MKCEKMNTQLKVKSEKLKKQVAVNQRYRNHLKRTDF